MPATPPAHTDGPDAVTAAVETLLSQLEREHGWAVELRQDAERADRTCQRLLAAVESALHTLPPPRRRPFYIRVMRMRNETPRMGRPPRDGRQAAVLDYLAERGEGPVTNAEIRALLAEHGLKGTTEYVGGLLAALAKEEVVMRLSTGRYAINPHHDRLMAVRWRRVRESEHEVLKAKGQRLRRIWNIPDPHAPLAGPTP